MLIPVYQNPALGGGPLGWSSCFCACTALQISFETGGQETPTTADVRRCCLNDDGTLDTTGGTNIAQNIAAAKRCFGVDLDYIQQAFETTWQQGQKPDVAISIAISYAVISGTEFDASPGFRGNHQVILCGGKVYDTLADGRRPGIPKGPQRWPKSLLMRAAGRVNVAPPGKPYRALGEGSAICVVGHALKGKPRRYSVKFEPGAIFVYEFAGGEWMREPDEFPKATSARCKAPETIPWLDGRKRVVEVIAGRLKGKRVEPGATHVRLVS